MPDTYTIADFEEQYTLSESNGLTTIRATHPTDGNSVIIKQFNSDADWFDEDRFQTVLDAWGNLDDSEPHVQSLVDTGFVSQPWIAVTDYTGGTATGQHLIEDVVVTIIGAAADTLSTAHNLGLYHAHLTPDTLLFETGEDPMSFVISDWEHALTTLPQPREVTRWNDTIDTPYLAPEHTGGATSTISTSNAVTSDIYQLGMIAYTLLNYNEPTETPDYTAIEETISPGFPDRDEFANALATAVDPDPNARYQSMAEFATDLKDIRVRV